MYVDLSSLADGVYVCDMNLFVSRTAATLIRWKKCELIIVHFLIGLNIMHAWIESICHVFVIETHSWGNGYGRV
jgi:light-independent protochlorophyllide reductase subunit N